MTAPTVEQVWAVSSDRAKWAHLFRDDRDVSVCGVVSYGTAVAPDRARCPRCVERADVPDVHDVLEATGATYRRLDYWVRTGLIKPSHEVKGSGSRRTWPPEEIEVARRMVLLLDAGLTLDAAHYAARNDGLLPGGRYQVAEAAE